MKNLFKAVLALFAICLTIGANAGVIVGDKEWRQVTDTVMLSWNDFDSVCDASDGSCSGSVTYSAIGTVSFDGWTWASQGDVAELFQGLNGWDGPQAPLISFDYRYTQSFAQAPASTWAPFIFDDLGFLPTDSIPNSRHMYGFVRTSASSELGYNNAIVDSSVIGGRDRAATNFETLKSARSDNLGGWFYKSVATTPSVPAPPTLALLLVPALMMVAVRRKRRA